MLFTAVLQAEREVANHEAPVVDRLPEMQVHVEHRPRADRYVWGVLRVMMGWIFFWPFLDKLFGLGFATEKGAGWIDGGSPTEGFLKFATKGPFKDLFEPLAGNGLVDAVFMIGLLGIGLALLFGVGVRIGAAVGALMLVLMYLAGFIWPEHNPFLDDHLVYGFILVGVYVTGAGHTLGLGDRWAKTRLVKRFRFLE